MKTLQKAKDDIRAALQAEAEEQARKREEANKSELQRVQDNLQNHLERIFDGFDDTVASCLRCKQNCLTLDVYNTWSPAADWLASKVVEHLDDYGYEAEVDKHWTTVQMADDCLPEDVYCTRVFVHLV